jgi:hypothetical protein
MKAYLTLLSLFVSIFVFSQEAIIEKQVNSIKNRGLERGLNIDSLMEQATFNGYPIKLKGIQVTDTLDSAGQVSRTVNGNHYEALIELHPSLLYREEVLETTLGHELGHFLGLHHCHEFCSAIMSGHLLGGHKGTSTYDRYYKSDFEEERWDSFFNKIRIRYNTE